MGTYVSGIFGGPQQQKPTAAPQVPSATSSMLSGLQYAETQRRLREARGRRSMFLTYGTGAQAPGSTDYVGRPAGSAPTLGG